MNNPARPAENAVAWRAIALLPLAVGALAAEDAVHAGRFTVEHPTLHNLGFEWAISGDDDRDASVAVEFRKAGEGEWRQALPLVRIGGERVFREREHLDYTVPDGFAGSILNLEPGTEYECRFKLADPDGTSGETEQLVRVSTRTEPVPYEGGNGLGDPEHRRGEHGRGQGRLHRVLGVAQEDVQGGGEQGEAVGEEHLQEEDRRHP